MASEASVFLSYSTADYRCAADLAQGLHRQGVEVFFAPEAVQPGDSYVERQDITLGRCTAFVLIWSRMAAASRWVQREREAALARSSTRPQLHVLTLDDTPLPSLWSAVQQVRGPGSIGRLVNTLSPRPSARTVIEDGEAISIGDLDDHETELACRMRANYGSDSSAEAMLPTLLVDGRLGRRLVLQVNVDLLGHELREIRDIVELVTLRQKNLRHYEKEAAGPHGVTINYEPLIDEEKGYLLQYAQRLRASLPYLVIEILRYQS